MTALLRPFLVLDLHGADTRRAPNSRMVRDHVEQAAIAGVGIGNHRDRHRIADAAHTIEDFCRSSAHPCRAPRALLIETPEPVTQSASKPADLDQAAR